MEWYRYLRTLRHFLNIVSIVIFKVLHVAGMPEWWFYALMLTEDRFSNEKVRGLTSKPCLAICRLSVCWKSTLSRSFSGPLIPIKRWTENHCERHSQESTFAGILIFSWKRQNFSFGFWFSNGDEKGTKRNNAPKTHGCFDSVWVCSCPSKQHAGF